MIMLSITNYYLLDGHGDVRALLDTDGAVTDTCRYNANGNPVKYSDPSGCSAANSILGEQGVSARRKIDSNN